MELFDLKNLVHLFFVHYEANEENLYNFLKEKQWEISRNYDFNEHKSTIIDELKQREYRVDMIPDDLINTITEKFEDNLYDNDYHWVDCMDDAIDYLEEDLEEYKLEEE